MSGHRIDTKIVKYRVVKPGEKTEAKAADAAPVARAREESHDSKVIWMHEKLERPGS